MRKKVIDILDRGDGFYEVLIPYSCEQSNDFDRQLRDKLRRMTQKRQASGKPLHSTITLELP